MPKIGYQTYYFWDEKEKAAHNTERHKVFRDELYLMYKDGANNSHLSHKEWDEKVAQFKINNFDLITK